MANSFAYNIIPPSGSALIAQATAANPIVFVESLSCTLAAVSDDDLASKGKAWYTGKTGQIQAASATDNRAHIVCRYSNSGSEQVAKSIAITARLASQADSEAVILCAKSDPDSDARLPGSEQIGQFVEFSYTIEINGSSTVTVTPGASATMADLDRFVSMHSAGNPNVGDAQSIRGTKDFLNDVYFEGTVYTGVLGTALPSGVIGLVSDIAPYSGASVKIGTSSAPIPEGNFTAMKAGNTMTSNLSSPATNINLRNPLIPSDNTASLGSDTNGFYDLYFSDQPGGGNVYNPPRPYTDSGDLYVRPGTIMLVYITRTDSVEKVIKAGSSIQVGAGSIGVIVPARMVSSGVVSPGTSGTVNWSFSSESLADYVFSALCDIVIPANQLGGIGLVICLLAL